MQLHVPTALACLLSLASALTATAGAQIEILSPSVVEREARPGEAYTGTIVLRNPTKVPQEAKAYQTDYRFYADGRSLFEDAGSTPRSNARWVVVSPSRIVIPPGETVGLAFSVAVPDSGAGRLRGSYWSLVMIEPIPPGSAESRLKPPAPDRPGVGLQTRVRHAVQLVTHIGTSGSREVALGTPRAVQLSGRRAVVFDVTNTGDRAYRPELTLELFSAAGEPAGKFRQGRGLVMPGTSIRQRFDVSTVPPGVYKALVIADTGGEEMVGAQYTLRF